MNCVDKKLGAVQWSHRDGRARELDWSDCTVLAQWRGEPWIPRNSRSRTSRSVTSCGELSIDVLTRTTAVLGCGWKQLPARQSQFRQQQGGIGLQQYLVNRPTLLSFLWGGDSQGYTPQSGEFIGHCHDQETAQLHQDAQDAVETDRKELDKSKQIPAGAHSTDPGGDAEAQVNCRLRTNVKQLDEAIVWNRKLFKEMDYAKTKAIVFITQETLHAFRLVIEQLSQFYKTSAKVIAETIQYTVDSTYKTVQEEWTRIECMIQSKFERINQETHPVWKAAQEAFILAGRTEFWDCSQWVKAMTSMPNGMIQNSRIEDSVSWTASIHQSKHRSSPFPHTSSEFSKQEQYLSMFQLARQVFDDEEDNCSGGARAQSIRPVLKTGAHFHKYKVKRSCRSEVRGCALNSVEHPHRGGNHEHDQILASSSSKLQSQKKRSTKLLLSSQRAARPRMWRWPRVWAKHRQEHWHLHWRRLRRHRLRNDLCDVHVHVKPVTEYPECSSSENSTPSLFACNESSYLKAYRDDKQKISA